MDEEKKGKRKEFGKKTTTLAKLHQHRFDYKNL